MDTSFLMEPGCPWVELRQLTGLPNVRWCENQLCSWIATPANTWSNLAYIALGFYFLWATRKSLSTNLKFFAPAALWVGWTSLIYHASLTFLTQVLDFLGMFIYFYLLIGQNFVRLQWIQEDRVKKFTWGFALSTTLVSAFVDRFGFPIQGLVVLLILVVLGTEIIARKKSTHPYSLKWFLGSLVSVIIAASFSASDLTRRFCEPDNHWIQGHAIWHLFGALALFCSFQYYRQFYDPKSGKLIR